MRPHMQAKSKHHVGGQTCLVGGPPPTRRSGADARSSRFSYVAAFFRTFSLTSQSNATSTRAIGVHIRTETVIIT